MTTTVNNMDTLMKHLEKYSIEDMMKMLRSTGYTDKNNNYKFDKESPFNIFAALASGIIKNPVNQSILDCYSNKWMVCHNRPENDDNWKDNNTKVSMAGPDINGPGHVFITTKSNNAKYFNIASIILHKEKEFLQDLLEVAQHYATKRNWNNPGFFFHCYPNNSVQSLHLHVVNMDNTGPSFELQKFKNLSIYDALEII